jgi:hypothetical protein
MNSQESCSLCKLSLVIKVIRKVVTLSLGLLESQLFCFVKFSFLVGCPIMLKLVVLIP